MAYHPIYANSMPLNSYGAVDVNANVPVESQIPIISNNITLPNIQSAAEKWANKVPRQPQLNVKSYVLMDSRTGNIIAEQNANMRIAPASLTKLMLLYIVETQLANKTISLDSTFNVPTVAWATGGSRMFLKPHTTVSVEDLIEGVIVASGNDAAVTLAVGIAGTQNAFVDMMNMKAKELGMSNTHFSDVMGLPAPNLYTSARDLGILAKHVINDFPQFYGFYKQKYISHNDVKQPNWNKLLFIDKYADGLKTGSTSTTGFSLISSEKRGDNRRLISVIIGANDSMSSAYNSLSLLKYGEQFFTTKEIYKSNVEITKPEVYLGEQNSIALGIKNNIAITYPRSIDENKITISVIPNYPLKAPIVKNTILGQIEIRYNNKTFEKQPLISLETVHTGSILKQTKDKIKLWFS